MVSVYILLVGSINCSYSSLLPCWQSESQDCSVAEPDHHRRSATLRACTVHFHSTVQTQLRKALAGCFNKEQSQAQLSQDLYELFSLCRKAGLASVLNFTSWRFAWSWEEYASVHSSLEFFFLTSWFRLTELDYNWQCWNCFWFFSFILSHVWTSVKN